MWITCILLAVCVVVAVTNPVQEQKAFRTVYVTKKVPHYEQRAHYPLRAPLRKPYSMYLPKPTYLLEVPKTYVRVSHPYHFEKILPYSYKLERPQSFPVLSEISFDGKFKTESPVSVGKPVLLQSKPIVEKPVEEKPVEDLIKYLSIPSEPLKSTTTFSGQPDYQSKSILSLPFWVPPSGLEPIVVPDVPKKFNSSEWVPQYEIKQFDFNPGAQKFEPSEIKFTDSNLKEETNHHKTFVPSVLETITYHQQEPVLKSQEHFFKPQTSSGQNYQLFDTSSGEAIKAEALTSVSGSETSVFDTQPWKSQQYAVQNQSPQEWLKHYPVQSEPAKKWIIEQPSEQNVESPTKGISKEELERLLKMYIETLDRKKPVQNLGGNSHFSNNGQHNSSTDGYVLNEFPKHDQYNKESGILYHKQQDHKLPTGFEQKVHDYQWVKFPEQSKEKEDNALTRTQIDEEYKIRQPQPAGAQEQYQWVKTPDNYKFENKPEKQFVPSKDQGNNFLPEQKTIHDIYVSHKNDDRNSAKSKQYYITHSDQNQYWSKSYEEPQNPKQSQSDLFVQDKPEDDRHVAYSTQKFTSFPQPDKYKDVQVIKQFPKQQDSFKPISREQFSQDYYSKTPNFFQSESHQVQVGSPVQTQLNVQSHQRPHRPYPEAQGYSSQSQQESYTSHHSQEPIKSLQYANEEQPASHPSYEQYFRTQKTPIQQEYNEAKKSEYWNGKPLVDVTPEDTQTESNLQEGYDTPQEYQNSYGLKRRQRFNIRVTEPMTRTLVTSTTTTEVPFTTAIPSSTTSQGKRKHRRKTKRRNGLETTSQVSLIERISY